MASKSFRIFTSPFRHLRDVPVHGRKPFSRWQATLHNPHTHHASRTTLWSSSRTLLLTALTGSAAYLYGVGESSRIPFLESWHASPNTRYGTKREMEMVIRILTSSLWEL